METKSTWYIGNIKINRSGINKNPRDSLVIPNQRQTGFDKNAEAEPVIAKTINIIVS